MSNKTCSGCNESPIETPVVISNRPGLAAVDYRIGSHSTFFQTMKNRLANLSLKLEDGAILYPLRQLTTRDSSDPAIALLDAWATVCDVLTFYQERIANEGFLGTATERRSLLELANLVGYRLKPGVAATVYLAFLLEDSFTEESVIPVGTGTQSVPGPGERPQTFETAEQLRARTVWNQLRPLQSCLPTINSGTINSLSSVYFASVRTGFKPNDPLLFQFGAEEAPVRRIMSSVTPEPIEGRTAVLLKPRSESEQMPRIIELAQTATAHFLNLEDHAVSSSTQMAQRVIRLLHSFARRLVDSMTGLQLQAALNNLLDPLCKEQSIAAEGQYARLAPWVNQMVESYQMFGNYLTQNLDLPSWTLTKSQSNALLEETTPQSGWLTADLIEKLTLPQALQPANSRRLARKAETLFSPQSDLRQRLLQSFYPRLKGTLYTAIENTTTLLLPPEETTLQAIRPLIETAAPFGATAPLKPVYDEGKIIGYREWELFEDVTVELIGQQEDRPERTSSSIEAFKQENKLLSVKMSKKGVSSSDTIILGEEPVFFFNSDGNIIFQQSLKVGTHQVDVSMHTAPMLRFGMFFNQIGDTSGSFRLEIDGMPVVYNEYPTGIENDSDTTVSVEEQTFDSFFPLTVGKHQIRVLYVIENEGDYDMYASTDDSTTVETIVLEESIFVQENRAYTILLIGDETHIDSIQLDNQPKYLPQGENRIRFINAAPDLLSIDIHATYRESNQIIENLPYLGISQYLYLSGTYASEDDLKIEVVGTTNLNVSMGIWSLKESNDFVILPDESTNSGYKIVHFPYFVIEDMLQAIFPPTNQNFMEGNSHASIAFDFVNINRLWSFEALLDGGESPKLVAHLVSRGRKDSLDFPPNKPTRIGEHDIEFTLNPPTFTDTGPAPLPTVRQQILALDGQYSSVQPGDWVAIERPDVLVPIITEVTAVHDITVSQFNVTAKATQLSLSKDWLQPTDTTLADLRQITVQIFSGAAELAPQPIDADVKGSEIVLNGLYEGLETGRWIVVTGERTDVTGTSGVIGKELMMIAGVEVAGQGGTSESPFDCQQQIPRTLLHLADDGLAYTYKRDTVVIYGNVVKATHGETRRDVLGSGSGSQTFQTFALKQKPLTFVPAINPSGVESSLEVRVNDVRWPETSSLVWLVTQERGYITQTDNEDVTRIIFGDGKQGARLPTGQENITAVYRHGIGKPGNVKAEQVKLLSQRPLGVSGVINPIAASGGADRERRDQARQNVPLGVMALDRLVSVQDYADFARTFAGIDKAEAVRISDGQVSQILLTIAGADDIPIDENSDLFQSLYHALREFGEPHQPILLKRRQRKVVILSAEVQILPDYLWESVESVIRTTLLDRFSFMHRQLGQPFYRSEITAVIQQISGVAYVDINVFASIDESEDIEKLLVGELGLADKIDVSGGGRDLQPAQIAYLNDDIDEKIILSERPLGSV